MAIDLVDVILEKCYCNNKCNKPLPICHRLLLVILTLASFQLIINAERITSSNSIDTEETLSILFNDLKNEGLLKKTQHKMVFVATEQSSKVLTDYNNEIEYVPLNDIEKQNSVVDNTVDFIITTNFPEASRFIERVLKTEGIVTVLINNNNPTTSFYKLPKNYKIVYVRQFDSVVVAMKKSATAINVKRNHAAPRKLFGYASDAKKIALQNLEDVLLEPPRAASGKSRKYLKRTRYLPDLMGDSLESYTRRVFIDVGLPEKEGGSGTDWFSKNYPTRNKNFEMYKIETRVMTEEESSRKEASSKIGMSDWLNKNVKEEEYVVMKAEAEVVEEMMRSNNIGLVDELFLECKPRHGFKIENKNRRAYWECLALYGKLRDEGVAVHQWWG
ncbi:hypothetical protein MtrunA17_Chr3g0133101 [Medicago truncatula]|uniref:DUF7870 domain-containing protein n=1 Tax=Medicago truncatula TaxID=3880 RepID=A0A396IZW7_MEDTR|nr:uncharacterized protein LOC11430603 [Medicago truncatula]RHN70211.1 hypothetical protein MtrunA17_Chr3g0133101 [Medicago truncatula]